MTELEAQKLREKIIAKRIHTRIPGWITYSRGLSAFNGADLRVLTYICSKIDNDTDIAYHSVTREEISRGTGVSLGSISGIIKDLIMRQYISTERSGRKNIFLVHFNPPESWPLHYSINKPRMRAAAKRREVLNKNLAASQPPTIQETPTSLKQSDSTVNSDYSASGLYGEEQPKKN